MSEGLGAASAPPAGVAASKDGGVAASKEAAVAALKTTTWLAVAAGAAGVLAALLRFGPSSEGVVTAALLGSMGALAVIDFREQVVPIRIGLPAGALVLALQLALFSDNSLEWILSAAITSGALLAVSLFRRDTLGAGDAQLGLILGAGLGTEAAFAILVGVLALWPYAAFLVLSEGVDARKKAIPLAPALAFGAAVVALSG
jgi:leader peptidase (prepilin peptidase)/N-methyltransferase